MTTRRYKLSSPKKETLSWRTNAKPPDISPYERFHTRKTIFETQNKRYTSFNKPKRQKKDFFWVGKVKNFHEISLPCEIVRGQIIPFSENEEGKIYYSGIDAEHNQVCGFGGVIAGRTISSRRRTSGSTKKTVQEDVVRGALREFTEESIYAFDGTFDVKNIFESNSYVIGNTFVILLKVNTTSDQINKNFEYALKNFKITSLAFLENKKIIASSSDQIQKLIKGEIDELDGFPIWSTYKNILSTLTLKYDVVL